MLISQWTIFTFLFYESNNGDCKINCYKSCIMWITFFYDKKTRLPKNTIEKLNILIWNNFCTNCML